MKAAPFAYARPATVGEAVAELARAGGDGKVLAGGQSLVPVLAMRLARPSVLIDINAVDGLGIFSINGHGLEIGATVRQRQAESDERTSAVPLLAMALPWVGHRELRSRGTVCGSLAHADPAAELPAVAACLDASLEVVGGRPQDPARPGVLHRGHEHPARPGRPPGPGPLPGRLPGRASASPRSPAATALRRWPAWPSGSGPPPAKPSSPPSASPTGRSSAT